MDKHQLTMIGILDVPRVLPELPEITDPDARVLSAILLTAARKWVSAREIKGATGWPARRIRAAAENAQGRVLSGPGSPGYKLTVYADADEIKHVCAALRHQARRMADKRNAIAQTFHHYQLKNQ